MAEEMKKIQPTHNDVLKGRGKRINRHPGNIQFLNIVIRMRQQYAFAPTMREKQIYAKRVLDELLQMDPPGRFLSPAGKKVKNEEWIAMSEQAALIEIRQALREGAPDVINKSRVVSPNSKDHHKIEGDSPARETKEHIGTGKVSY